MYNPQENTSPLSWNDLSLLPESKPILEFGYQLFFH